MKKISLSPSQKFVIKNSKLHFLVLNLCVKELGLDVFLPSCQLDKYLGNKICVTFLTLESPAVRIYSIHQTFEKIDEKKESDGLTHQRGRF